MGLIFGGSALANEVRSGNPGIMGTGFSVPKKPDPFCKAIMEGDIDTVKRLIELGADLNKKSMGLTPAIFAARYNKAAILELLIENGADLRIRSDRGYTIKKYAELAHAEDAIRVLDKAMEG